MCICAPPRTPPEGVVIYGQPDWPDVRSLHSFFEDRGVVFDAENTARQPDALDRMQCLSGQTEQAVTVIGKSVFVGYVPDQIERVLP